MIISTIISMDDRHDDDRFFELIMMIDGRAEWLYPTYDD